MWIYELMKLKSGNNKNYFQDIPAGYNLIKKHILDETNQYE